MHAASTVSTVTDCRASDTSTSNNFLRSRRRINRIAEVERTSRSLFEVTARVIGVHDARSTSLPFNYDIWTVTSKRSVYTFP